MATLYERYEQTMQKILEQKLPGTYSKQRPSQSNRILLGLGISNLILGAVMFLTYFNLTCTTIPYNTIDIEGGALPSSQLITKSLYIPAGISYLYIELEGVYQNYLSYTKSISYGQLEGKADGASLSNTKPFDYAYYTNGNYKVYYPAGAIPATLFQDELSLMSQETGQALEIRTDGIARNSEINQIGITQYLPQEIAIPKNWTPKTGLGSYALNQPENSLANELYSKAQDSSIATQQGLDSTILPIIDERFVNWINLSAFSSFKKLWGILDVEQAGNYDLSILSNYKFANKKSIKISEKSILGIPNYFAVFLMVLVGVSCIVSSIFLNTCGY